MNCQSCNTRIDYRFLTRCSHCDAEIGPSLVLAKAGVKDLCVAKNFTWFDGVINLAYLVVTSIAGLISGAVALYSIAGIGYLVFFSHSGNNDSYECARGTAYAIMSILLGALLGMVAGIVFAARSLPRKPAVQ